MFIIFRTVSLDGEESANAKRSIRIVSLCALPSSGSLKGIALAEMGLEVHPIGG